MSLARGPFLLVVPAGVLVGTLVWHLWLRGEPGLATGPARPAPEATDAETRIATLTGELELPDRGRRVLVRVGPLHGELGLQRHEADVLARRFALPEGAPWRATFTALDPEGEPAPPDLELEPEVVDAAGLALQPLARLVRPGDRPDPLRALFGAGELRLGDGAVSVLLWGRDPGEAAELVLVGKTVARASSCPLAREEVPCGTLPRHVARLDPSDDDR